MNYEDDTLHRVVITGLGTVSPCGHDVPTSWNNIVSGRSGVAPITLFPTDDLNVKIAAEVKEWDPMRYMEAKDARRRDQCVRFAVVAAREGARQAGLTIDEWHAFDIGVFVGTAVGGLNSYYDVCSAHILHGARRVGTLAIPLMVGESASSHVALELGARGPNMARPQSIRTVMTNSCGFGGHHTVLILKRLE